MTGAAGRMANATDINNSDLAQTWLLQKSFTKPSEFGLEGSLHSNSVNMIKVTHGHVKICSMNVAA